MKTVYLAGPISGCSFEGCTDWRNAVIKRLAPWGIRGISPMRAKDYLNGMGKIEGSYEDKVMSCQRGIITRDRYDSTTCDAILVNFLGASRVSVGTVLELGWCDLARTPIICAIEPTGNPHDHPMVREIIGFRVSTLEEAVDCVIKILGDVESVGLRKTFAA